MCVFVLAEGREVLGELEDKEIETGLQEHRYPAVVELPITSYIGIPLLMIRSNNIHYTGLGRKMPRKPRHYPVLLIECPMQPISCPHTRSQTVSWLLAIRSYHMVRHDRFILNQYGQPHMMEKYLRDQCCVCTSLLLSLIDLSHSIIISWSSYNYFMTLKSY